MDDLCILIQHYFFCFVFNYIHAVKHSAFIIVSSTNTGTVGPESHSKTTVHSTQYICKISADSTQLDTVTVWPV